MTADQLLLFRQSHRLQDVDMLDRLRGAEVLLADETDEAERWLILALVVAPSAFGAEVER
jgi:hypothetical protein